MYNTHEITYEGGCVHFLSTFPDFAVVVGEKEILNELNTCSLIKQKDENCLPTLRHNY